MKKLYYLSLFFLCSLFVASCSDDDNENLPDISVTSSVDNIMLPAAKNAQYTIEFVAGSNWKAETDVEWATVSPRSGNAGEVKISLIAKESNNTGLDRSGVLKLTGANGTPVEIAFTQFTSDVVLLKQAKFDVPCEGQDLVLEFATNVDGK